MSCRIIIICYAYLDTNAISQYDMPLKTLYYHISVHLLASQ
ncbi:hypothetical protein NT01EI_3045 [Edwardsiella ictaluri 93-146]|uniref:Uncharacterized protein n=1 Tax=Edwardsiella ictaluri (strain 93-146) TaxID=634503 RepID=C5BAJ1_EDWI9|nr:hypothetical protein NT01EI_3045 [Edwardsiella ictaluri 93-146]